MAELRGAHKVALSGEGTEFLFFTAYSDEGVEGYRIPRSPIFNTTNNPHVAALGLQEKEYFLSRWAVQEGISGGQVRDLLDIEGYPVLVLAVIDDDGSPLDPQLLGGLLAQMHGARPPEWMAALAEGRSFGTQLARRITQRYAAAGQWAALPKLPLVSWLRNILDSELTAGSVAHLDLRRQNFRVVEGRVCSLFDWSNAMIAPVEMEMARLHEYALIEENGIDYPGVQRGYRASGAGILDGGAAWVLLRLDAAVMLAGVFRSLAPNQKLAQLFSLRCEQLVNSL